MTVCNIKNVTTCNDVKTYKDVATYIKVIKMKKITTVDYNDTY